MEKSVWSLPMPTLMPGWMGVPRWRTMIVPARTACPSERLTPNILGLLSRPLRDEPTPFLCAIVVSFQGSAVRIILRVIMSGGSPPRDETEGESWGTPPNPRQGDPCTPDAYTLISVIESLVRLWRWPVLRRYRFLGLYL